MDIIILVKGGVSGSQQLAILHPKQLSVYQISREEGLENQVKNLILNYDKIIFYLQKIKESPNGGGKEKR